MRGDYGDPDRAAIEDSRVSVNARETISSPRVLLEIWSFGMLYPIEVIPRNAVIRATTILESRAFEEINFIKQGFAYFT